MRAQGQGSLMAKRRQEVAEREAKAQLSDLQSRRLRAGMTTKKMQEEAAQAEEVRKLEAMCGGFRRGIDQAKEDAKDGGKHLLGTFRTAPDWSETDDWRQSRTAMVNATRVETTRRAHADTLKRLHDLHVDPNTIIDRGQPTDYHGVYPVTTDSPATLTTITPTAALLRQAESELSQAIDDLPMTAAHNQHFGVVPRPDTRGGVLTSGNGEAHADREADLSDPEDMFVNGAGSGWRPPGGGEAAAALLGVSGSRPELFNTTLMASGMDNKTVASRMNEQVYIDSQMYTEALYHAEHQPDQGQLLRWHWYDWLGRTWDRVPLWTLVVGALLAAGLVFITVVDMNYRNASRHAGYGI